MVRFSLNSPVLDTVLFLLGASFSPINNLPPGWMVQPLILPTEGAGVTQNEFSWHLKLLPGREGIKG